MTPIEAIAPIAAQPVALTGGGPVATAGAPGDFGAMLARGLETVDTKVADADRMVARFALDDSVPVHHVTIALEEARLAVELATQVRQRLVESYRELMNMQL